MVDTFNIFHGLIVIAVTTPIAAWEIGYFIFDVDIFSLEQGVHYLAKLPISRAEVCRIA